MKKRLVVSVLLICMLSVVSVPATNAFSLGDVLKVGGIGFLIDKFATPLNNFINTLTFKHGGSHDYATKVVPIITAGSGGYVGAAQIIGPQALVNKTQAALQVEGEFNGRQFRVKALIPIDSKNPVKFSRVNGVGVSAMIDIKI